MKKLATNKQNVPNEIYSSLPSSLNTHLLSKNPASMLKQQISEIIKYQLKNFKVRAELVSQLSEHHKKEKNKQLSKAILQTKLQAHHENERIRKTKKYEQFQKKQAQREQKLKKFQLIKQKQHEQKFNTVNRMIETAKSRYKQITNQDSNLRLSKLTGFNSCDKNFRDSRYSRSSKSSCSQSRQYDIMKPDDEEREIGLVTNYINKIKRSQSRVLQKELQREKRKQNGRKQKVKCFVMERAKNELEKMERDQKEYKARMKTFQSKNFKIHQSRQTQYQNRSLVNLKHYKLIQQRRQLLKQYKIESIILRNDTWNQHPLQFFKSSIDSTNDSRLLQLNLKKMIYEDAALKQRAKQKLIDEKLQKIKDLKYGQRLDDRSIKIVLGMLDKNDPEYATIAQFLQSQRKSYLQALAKREQQRSKLQKNKKTNKNLGKTMT